MNNKKSQMQQDTSRPLYTAASRTASTAITHTRLFRYNNGPTWGMQQAVRTFASSETASGCPGHRHWT